mmetsp:Transcript_41855/g.118396  ORF Transcript_41855/g.118396 Transcript_41855/m.118396 type:complete len:145 (+) Transcript_41855:70-504(+)
MVLGSSPPLTRFTLPLPVLAGLGAIACWIFCAMLIALSWNPVSFMAEGRASDLKHSNHVKYSAGWPRTPMANRSCGCSTMVAYYTTKWSCYTYFGPSGVQRVIDYFIGPVSSTTGFIESELLAMIDEYPNIHVWMFVGPALATN